MGSAVLFRLSTPIHMVWLATNACNARCLHCSSNAARPLANELTTDEALGLMDELADLGVLDLAVSGGEPLIRGDLFRVIRRARSRGLSVGVGTNGSLLDRRRARALAEVGVSRIQVSLDGEEAEHDQLRRWPGLFRRAVAAIETASAIGLRVNVCCTVTRLNYSRLDAFMTFAAALPIQRVNFSRYVPTGRPADGLDLEPASWASVAAQIASFRRQYRGRLEVVTHLAQEALVDPDIAAPAFIGCQAGRGQGCVTADGTIFPCVLLPVPIGSIRTGPIAKQWLTSPVIRELQDRRNLEAPCGDCPIVDRCGGCRAVAFAVTGRISAADPRCWAKPSRLN